MPDWHIPVTPDVIGPGRNPTGVALPRPGKDG